MKTLKGISVFYLLLVFFTFNTILNAQNAEQKSAKNDNVEKMVTKLQQKVLLSEDQTSDVRKILNAYYEGSKTPESLANAQTKIEALLDEKQKAKFEIIKQDWWKGLNKVSREVK